MSSNDSRIHIEGLKPADVALLRDVAEAAAEQAVKKTMIAMGLDPNDPLEVQADMLFLRATRARCESLVGKTIAIAFGILVVTAMGLLWAGFMSKFGGKP